MKVEHTKKCLIQAVVVVTSGTRGTRAEMTPLKDWFDFRQSSPAHCECVVGLNGSESFWSARMESQKSSAREVVKFALVDLVQGFVV